MSERPKIAIYWLGACGGCDSSLIDLGESLLELSREVEIIIWPVALDFKHERLKALPDGSLALSMLSGCVRNSDHRKIAELLRAKSRRLLAVGSCACFGGIPGLANLRLQGDIKEWVYKGAQTVANPEGILPGSVCETAEGVLRLPEFFDHVYSLNQVVEVDYSLPGCPPPVELLHDAIRDILAENPPQPGRSLAPGKPLCDSCDRNRSRPLRLEIRKIRRIHETVVPSGECFLVHGVICLGPATRDGCGGSCLTVSAPCRGCFGPVDGVRDAGARFLSSIASLLAPADEAELRVMIEDLADPAGYACRFTQPVSILGEKSMKKEETE